MQLLTCVWVEADRFAGVRLAPGERPTENLVTLATGQNDPDADERIVRAYLGRQAYC